MASNEVHSDSSSQRSYNPGGYGSDSSDSSQDGGYYDQQGGHRGQRGTYRDIGGEGKGSPEPEFIPKPDRIVPIGYFSHKCEDNLVCKATISDVPKANAMIYLDDKTEVGNVDDILGSIHSYYFTTILGKEISELNLKEKQTLFIDPEKLLPLQTFMPKQSTSHALQNVIEEDLMGEVAEVEAVNDFLKCASESGSGGAGGSGRPI